jgi:Fur family zinc uptake transcriptional regulator
MQYCYISDCSQGAEKKRGTMAETLFPMIEHDHDCCVESAVERAQALCQEQSVRLTPLREAVLRTLLSSHRALGAYDIIDKLHERGRRLAPISVYRVIEVLLDAGLVHRLESRNAFFACLAEHDDTRSLLVLVCEDCARVAEAEAPEAWTAIKSLTQMNGFQVNDTVLEIRGICADCRDTAGTGARGN